LDFYRIIKPDYLGNIGGIVLSFPIFVQWQFD